jgi:hypothetical protein
MIRASRILVIASTVLAALAESFLASTYTPQLFWTAVAGFALMLIAGRLWRHVAMPVLMAALYLTPSLLLVTFNTKGFEHDTIWILPLLGLLLSDRGEALRWSLPARWQWPLVTWAVIVAITWPIVFLREADFAPWILLDDVRVSNTSIGVPPSLVNLSVTYYALGHMLGILLVDALCRWYRADEARFRREVLRPLLAAAGIAALVACYQGFVDLGFLNEGFWEYMIRASGTLGDPNKLGAVAAFWTVGASVFGRRMRQPWNAAITLGGLVLGMAAVWLSGSRTGLAAVLISVPVAALEAVRWLKLDLRKLALAAGGVLVIGATMIMVLQNASTHTIVQRGTLGYLPFFGDRGIAQSANELLWDRFGYGPAAIQMIKEHPLNGVGVGTFHSLSYDFGRAAGRIIPAQDNAQAWWRHNLAELGLLGFIPMIWWCVVFGRSLFSRRAGVDRLSTGMLRGVLVGFFIASLFGVPSQSVAITLTFWIFAFWIASEQPDVEAPGIGTTPTKRSALRASAITVVLIATQAAITAYDAFGDLRPRHRAERFDWYYRHGWVMPDDVERDPGGNPIGRRWTKKDSLAVIKVKGKTLKFVAWNDHPDSDVRPVHTRVWADSKLVFEGDLRRAPLMLDIPATPGKTHMLIETSIDRTWRPSDSGTGSRDGRELGLSIRDWVWE